MIYYLREDENSYNFKNYARKGDQVKVVAEFGRVMIVELLSNRNRFSVKESNLSKEKIEKDFVAEILKGNIKKSSKSSSRR
jgi:hypothetical protein